MIFAGLGLGIAATGTLVPFLLRFGLQATWIWLAVFAAALTVLTWTSWPPSEFITKREEGTHHRLCWSAHHRSICLLGCSEREQWSPPHIICSKYSRGRFVFND